MNRRIHRFYGTSNSMRIRYRFMEKKVKRTTASVNKREEKTIMLTILVALVIMGALLLKLTVFTPIETKPFSAIYYLDSEKQTTNLPKTVVLGENNTVTLWVGVENQNATTMDYSVQIKVDDGKGQIDPSLVEPRETFENTLEDGDLWEFQVTINIKQLGTNRIIFELWYLNTTSLDYEYTGNWVNLSVEAT